MSTETALADLTLQVTNTLDVFTAQSASIDADIAAAVLASENASQIPLTSIATDLINTQATFITYINAQA
jgi:hypothetical protein